MSHKIDRGWLFTEVLCHNTELDSVGVKVEDFMSCCIKLDQIIAFKEDGDLSGEKALNTVVYTEYEHFVIRIEYDEFVKLFMGGVK